MGKEFRHTGVWPFCLFEGVKGNAAGAAADVKIFDPVALAWKAGPKLIDAGWVGLDLMPNEFLWEVVDADAGDVPTLADKWIEGHKDQVADEFEKRLQSYAVDDELAVQASTEALEAYRAGCFLATVRTLMPETERFGRKVVMQDGRLPGTQKEAVEAIQEYLGGCPVSEFSAIESLTIYHVITEDLFATCFTEADAQGLGAGPNRHAEVHGLASYGDLCGATKMLCVQDFLLHVVMFGRRQIAETAGAT